MAAYRTRSNTQKLQRLIEFLKERDCDSAANLEASAEVFLNDVKPKAHIDGIPHYDGTESDDGSSYVEEAEEKSEILPKKRRIERLKKLNRLVGEKLRMKKNRREMRNPRSYPKSQ